MLVIDEIDKADLSLPHDMLATIEDGEYLVRELARVARRTPKVVVHTADPGGSAEIIEGRVTCRAFPFIVFTSNREREFRRRSCAARCSWRCSRRTRNGSRA
nr:hypothetical protein [Nocardia sp. NRRL S-836]